MFECQKNTSCITHNEPVESLALRSLKEEDIRLKCKYCEKYSLIEIVTEDSVIRNTIERKNCSIRQPVQIILLFTYPKFEGTLKIAFCSNNWWNNQWLKHFYRIYSSCNQPIRTRCWPWRHGSDFWSVPVNPATGEVSADIAEQARQSLDNVQAVVGSASGPNCKDIVKLTVFVKDLNDFGTVNETLR